MKSKLIYDSIHHSLNNFKRQTLQTPFPYKLLGSFWLNDIRPSRSSWLIMRERKREGERECVRVCVCGRKSSKIGDMNFKEYQCPTSVTKVVSEWLSKWGPSYREASLLKNVKGCILGLFGSEKLNSGKKIGGQFPCHYVIQIYNCSGLQGFFNS